MTNVTAAGVDVAGINSYNNETWKNALITGMMNPSQIESGKSFKKNVTLIGC
jgi:hypothetical protein